VSLNWCWANAEHLPQAYVIATSTLVDISKVDVSKFDDTYFKSTEKKEKKKSEDGFFGDQTEEKKELGAEYVENQKKVNSTATSIVGFCLMHVLNSLAHVLHCPGILLCLCAHMDGAVVRNASHTCNNIILIQAMALRII